MFVEWHSSLWYLWCLMAICFLDFRERSTFKADLESLGLKCSDVSWKKKVSFSYLFIYLLIVYVCFSFFFLLPCMSIWGCQKPWNWSHRVLWAVMWMQGVKLRSSGRVASALNHWHLPGCQVYFLTLETSVPLAGSVFPDLCVMKHTGKRSLLCERLSLLASWGFTHHFFFFFK